MIETLIVLRESNNCSVSIKFTIICVSGSITTRIQKVLPEGVRYFDNNFFLVDEGRKDPTYHYKRAIIDLPEKIVNVSWSA